MLAVIKVDPDLTLPYLLNLDYDFTGDITPCLLRLQKHYREKKIKELAVHLKSKPQKASEIITRIDECHDGMKIKIARALKAFWVAEKSWTQKEVGGKKWRKKIRSRNQKIDKILDE